MAYIGSTPAPQMPEVGTGAVETQDIQDGAVTAAKLAPGAAVPSQTGNLGKYLTTDGTTSSWGLAVASFNTRTGAVTLSSGDVTGALGFTPYNSTNPNGYISGITSGNVTTALGFTPYNATNPNGYISSITSSNVTTALGYTPYNATNPSGYTTNTGTVTNVGGTGTVSGLTLTGSVSTTGNLTLGGTLSLTSGNVTTALGFTPENSANRGVANGYASLDGSGLVPSTQLPSYVDDVLEYANLAGFPGSGTSGKIYVAIDTNKTYRWSGSAYVYITSGAVDSVAGKTGVVSLVSSDVGLGNVENKSSATIRGEISSANVTAALGFTPYNSTNPNGYITGITSANVTSALGYTPYNSSNPSGYITGITSANVTSALGFTPYNSTNPNGYITSSGSISGSAGSLSSNSSYMFFRDSVAEANIDSATANGFYTVSMTGQSSSLLTWNAGGSTGPVQINVSYGGIFRYRNKIDSSTWNAWKTFLHSDNYNSYAPTLTGTGASGTWGINISGNASTASSSPLLSALGYYVWTASTAPSAYNLGIQTSFVNDGLGYQSYGSVINVKSYSGGGGSLQMFVPYSPSYGGNSLAVRFGNYDAGDAWTSWKTLLASDNYTSYAMPSGASATNSVDVRAPIFYDSNNTAYYVDPNSFSRVNSIAIGNQGSLIGSDTTYSASIYHNARYLLGLRYSGSGTSNYPWIVHDQWNGDALIFHFNGIADRFRFSSGGIAQADDSFRAPAFYDSNNSAYYVDPASQSNLDTVRISKLQQGQTTVFDWGIALTGGYYHGYGDGNVARHEIMRIAIDYNDWNAVGSVIIELSENYYSTGGYSKWYVYYGYVNSGGVQLMEANGGWGGSSITVGSPVQVSGDHYYLPVYANVQGYYQVSGRVTTSRSITTANPPGIGNTLILTTPNITNPGLTSAPVPSYGVFGGNYLVDNLYTQVVYDSGNTGYYTDPASTSVMNTVNVNALNIGGVAVTAGGGGAGAFVAFGTTG